jgi:GT2 family glycosyltransferase
MTPTLPSPQISVVVPTYDRPRELRRCLDGLAALDYPKDRYEVIVVDDGGREPAEPALISMSDRLEVKVVCQENGGPSAARNAGAAVARGELLAFLDDDCVAAVDWLRRLAHRHAQDPDATLGGTIRTDLVTSPLATVTQLIIAAASVRHHGDPSNARQVTTGNMAVPARAFAAVGGFSVDFRTSEDRDFCDRWTASGRRIRFVHEAVVHHNPNLTLGRFVRRHFAYGRGARRFHKEHADRSGKRVQIQPSSYLRVHRMALGEQGLARMLLLQLLLVVWNATYLAGFLWEGVAGQRR